MKIDGFSDWKKEQVESKSDKDSTQDRRAESVFGLKGDFLFYSFSKKEKGKSAPRRLGTSPFGMETFFGNGRRNKQIVCGLFRKLDNGIEEKSKSGSRNSFSRHFCLLERIFDTPIA